MDDRSNLIEITADKESAGERLDIFLSRRCPWLSRSKIQKSIADRVVLLNGRPVPKKTLLDEGDFVTIDKKRMSGRSGPSLTPQDIPLDILYEDEFLLAVNKPAGMVVHPGNANREGTLVHALLHHTRTLSTGFEPDRPGIVHRLDKDTSGVVLVAKTDEAHYKLARLFSSREIKKRYAGICVGRRPEAHGSIEAPLGRSRCSPVKRSVRSDGKESLTEYWLLEHCCGVSVMRFSPHTGRTHQIRVHCSVSGFPVLADPLYGGGKEAVGRLPVLARPFAYSVFKCFSRHALHARSITFVHPQTHKPQTVVAPLPEDFKKALALFEKNGEGLARSID